MPSPAFDFVSTQLEAQTTFNAIEARGTVRLALKTAGLDAATVTPGQMAIVVARLLPGELTMRRIADAAAICAGIERGLSHLDASAAGDTTDEVFRRLGG